MAKVWKMLIVLWTSKQNGKEKLLFMTIYITTCVIVHILLYEQFKHKYGFPVQSSFHFSTLWVFQFPVELGCLFGISKFLTLWSHPRNDSETKVTKVIWGFNKHEALNQCKSDRIMECRRTLEACLKCRLPI